VKDAFVTLHITTTVLFNIELHRAIKPESNQSPEQAAGALARERCYSDAAAVGIRRPWVYNIWLGSSQPIRQVSICDVPVLSTRVKPVEPARDLGVIFDSQ